MLHCPVCVDDDLTISIKRGTTRSSPGEALSVAEKLIRTSTRRIILEEQADSLASRGATNARRSPNPSTGTNSPIVSSSFAATAFP